MQNLKRVEELFHQQARQGRRPKYLTLSEAIAAAVKEGTYAPGDRLPNEVDVADALPVSLGTVQKALGLLSDKGLVRRTRRSGSFINDWTARSQDALIYRFTDEATGQPLVPLTRALMVDKDNTAGPWREALGGRSLVRLDRLVWVDESVPAFSQVYLPMRYGRPLLRLPVGQLHNSSYHRFLADSYSLPSLHVSERIRCGVLLPAALSALRLPEGTAGIFWEVTEFTIGQEPFVFQRLQLPPDHRPIEVQRSAPALG